MDTNDFWGHINLWVSVAATGLINLIAIPYISGIRNTRKEDLERLEKIRQEDLRKSTEQRREDLEWIKTEIKNNRDFLWGELKATKEASMRIENKLDRLVKGD